jgi:hypothetical protein
MEPLDISPGDALEKGEQSPGARLIFQNAHYAPF